jgi:hypothetical protein
MTQNTRKRYLQLTPVAKIERDTTSLRQRVSMLRYGIAVLVVLMFASAQLCAQVNTATLQGASVDPAGAVVPGTTIAVRNTATDVVRNTITDEKGDYFLAALQPGSYEIIASHVGFQTVKQTSVTLTVGQVATLNFTLPIGNVSQTVEVATTSSNIENYDTTLGTVISQRQVVDLPLNGRQFSQLIQLAPGVVPVDNSQNTGKAPNFGAGASSPGVNGQSNRSNLFFVDGIIDSNPFFGGFSFSPSIDDIQEFKAQSHTDQAEYGQATGAIVSVITRPGTNSFHGEVYEFVRNTIFNTQIKNFAATPQPKLPYHQNQFGGSLGGPIFKDKLFFFANYEGGRLIQPQPSYSTVPTTAERNGDFSGVLPGNTAPVTIYDPSTYNPVTQTESPFPDNKIPTASINTGMQAYLNGIYPMPNIAPGVNGTNNYLATTGNTTIADQGTVRIDYNLGKKDILMGKYSQNSATLSSPASLANLFETGFNGKNTGGSWIHTYSPTLVSDVVVAYNSLNIPQAVILPVSQDALFASAGLGAGFNKNPGLTPFTLVPGYTLEGGNYSGFWNGAGPIGPMDIWQFSGSVSKTEGHHSLKFGGSFYHTAMYTNWSGNNEDFSNKGTWNAACQFAGSNPAALTACPSYDPTAGNLGGGGDPVASMLLSLPIDATRALGNTGVNLRQNTTTAFAQDTWVVKPKLTVTYGLRWDYNAPMTEANNRLAVYDIYTKQYLVVKGNQDLPAGPLPANVTIGSTNSITTKHYNGFQPRLGFAYQFTPKTTLRLGIGRSIDSWGLPLQVGQQDRGAWPSGYSQNASIQTLNVAGISYKPDGTPYSGQNPFVGTATLPASPFPLGGLGFQDTKWQSASSYQWNVQVQQEFDHVGTFSLAYVGSQTEHLTNPVPYNLATPSTNTTKVYPDTVFGGPGSDLQSGGTGKYSALQAQLSRTYAGGLAFNAAFTWSKSRALAQCGDFYTSCIQNPYNVRADYGATSLDVPLVFTFNSTYQLPFGKGKQYLTSGPSSWIFGGWQVNGIIAARDGTVINPANGVNGGNNADIANSGGGEQRVNFVGNPNTGAPHQIGAWFNAAAFQLPANGTYGNAGLDSLRGPGFVQVDASIFRDIPFTERATLQFRVEAFNLFNHPNLANPNGTFGFGGFNAITATSSAGTNRVGQLAAKLIF